MARFGNQHPADMLIVAGVKFMGETAKVLTPEKTVVMPTLEATCSLRPRLSYRTSLMPFVISTQIRKVVVYANTSPAVKARADWIVTSSCALEIVEHLDEQGDKIIWGPDRHLGNYIQKQTGADMIMWQGACIVHDEFKTKALTDMKALHPDAAILVHPESPAEIVELADCCWLDQPTHKSGSRSAQQKIYRGNRSRYFL